MRVITISEFLPLSPLPSLLPRLQSWERKENVIWKWENNYLIITFNTEASITACTVSALQYIIQYRATKIRSARVRRRGSKLLMTWYLPEIITIFFHRLKFFSKPIHWLSNSQSVSPPPLCKNIIIQVVITFILVIRRDSLLLNNGQLSK